MPENLPDWFPNPLARVLLEPSMKRIGLAEVARRAGLSRPTVALWLKGKDAGLETRLKIALAVGCSVRCEVGPVPPPVVEGSS